MNLQDGSAQCPAALGTDSHRSLKMSNISNNIFGVVAAVVASTFGFALTLI